MRSLGLDTSNYTSSVALAEGGQILADKRIILTVKPGQQGLRQSEALYQHWNNIPDLLEELWADHNAQDTDIICVSTRPRPQTGSYMPVFNGGLKTAQLLGNALNKPIFELSHQEGHIIAAAYQTEADFKKPLICAHLSGGTLELVLLKDGCLSIVGGTKDISYGQLIDRIGVFLGLQFPAGKYADKLALSFAGERHKNGLCKASVDGSWLNLSGLENQLKSGSFSSPEETCCLMMERIAESFKAIADNAMKESGAEQLLLMGGVASSQFLRNYFKNQYIFGNQNYCADNACGAALSEGHLPWL